MPRSAAPVRRWLCIWAGEVLPAHAGHIGSPMDPSKAGWPAPTTATPAFCDTGFDENHLRRRGVIEPWLVEEGGRRRQNQATPVPESWRGMTTSCKPT